MSDPPYEDPFLRALAENWDQITGLADDEQKALLTRLASGVELDDQIDIRAALADEVMLFLPGDHPVIEALRGGVMSGTGVVASDLNYSIRRLRELVGPMPGFDPPPAAPAGTSGTSRASETGRTSRTSRTSSELDDFDREVRENLQALPWLSPSQVRGRNIDPGLAGLIRLPPDGDGEAHLPRFQFDDDGRPRPVVLRVNELLNATIDPWGVTCWWIYPHARLDRTPVDLLGNDDQLLLRAAAAVREA